MLASGCGPVPAADPPRVTSSSTTGAAVESRRPPLAGEAMFFLDADHHGSSSHASFAPDGARLAMCHAPHRVSIRSARDGAVLLELDTPGDVQALGFRDDGARLHAITELGAVVWDAQTGAPVLSMALPALGLGKHARFSASGRWLVVVDRAGSMRVIDAETGAVTSTVAVKPGATIERFGSASDRLLLSLGKGFELREIPGGKRLSEHAEGSLSPDMRMAIATGEGAVRLVDAATGAELWKHTWGTYRYKDGQADVETRPVSTWAFWRADGARVALVSEAPGGLVTSGSRAAYEAQLSVLDVAARKLTVLGFRVGTLDPEWSRDGKVLFVGRPPPDPLGAPPRVALDLATGAPVKRDPPPGLDPSYAADAAGSIAVRDTGRGASVMDGKTGAALWNVAHPWAPPAPERYRKVVVSRSEPWIAFTASEVEKEVFGLRLDRGEPFRLPSDLGALPRELLASGSTLVGLGGAGWGGVQVWAWNETGKPAKTLTIGDERPFEKALLTSGRPVAVSDDGRLLALVHEKEVEVYDAKSGRLVVKIPGEGPAHHLRFDPAGTLLAVEYTDRIHMVGLPGGEALAGFPGFHGDWRLRQGGALVFLERDPEALDSRRRRTAVYDGRTGKLLSTDRCDLEGSTVSSDGRLFLLNDGVWDMETCSRRLDWPGPGSGGFSTDAKHLVIVVGDEGAALVFSTATWALERAVRVPRRSEMIGASGDLVALRTLTGAALLRPATGEVYRVDLPGGAVAGLVTSLDRGHFDAAGDVAAHVRLFVPGAKDGPVVRGPGPGQEAFRRKGLHEDFFPRR